MRDGDAVADGGQTSVMWHVRRGCGDAEPMRDGRNPHAWSAHTVHAQAEGTLPVSSYGYS